MVFVNIKLIFFDSFCFYEIKKKYCRTGITIRGRLKYYYESYCLHLRTSSGNVPPRARGAESRCRLFLRRAALLVMPWQPNTVDDNLR